MIHDLASLLKDVPRTPQGSVRACLWRAALSALIYKPAPIVRSAMEALPGVVHYEYYDQSGTQAGLVVFQDGSAEVVFRGTDQLYDWFYNGSISQVDANGIGLVHAGAHAHQGNVSSQIAMDIKRHAIKAVFLSGHSLGAMDAAIMGAYFPKTQVRAVYLYGSPRIGNAYFARNYPHSVYRHSRWGDPATKLLVLLSLRGGWIPWPSRWVHLGDCILLGSSGIESTQSDWSTYLKVTARNWRDSLSEGKYLAMMRNAALANIPYHGIEANYVTPLYKAWVAESGVA